ncbi:hypothetical protein Pcinc_016160 [Petrolisthes cinctipes]|uniref:Uncharacterized protein n=1 Tax=Petrolisthes cinctipes TaxID=88211 RepID=A0AAE1FSU7_PETCI|nr:hypothetical protein Pcinc_016160 [Petrolisthes cinctipes]
MEMMPGHDSDDRSDGESGIDRYNNDGEMTTIMEMMEEGKMKGILMVVMVMEMLRMRIVYRMVEMMMRRVEMIMMVVMEILRMRIVEDGGDDDENDGDDDDVGGDGDT